MDQPLPKDMLKFLANYPGNKEDNLELNANLEFYSGQGRSEPDGIRLHEYQKRWDGDYVRLERNHNYIQWLFPIQEVGVNPRSQALQKHEIEAMRADKEIIARVQASYRIMLDFYGMQLKSPETGLLVRSEPEEKWQDRYDNFERNRHNFMRITRILKCLSELGLEHLNAGFLLFVLKEQGENKLNMDGLKTSMDRWWANCIRNDKEREWVAGMIQRVRGGNVVFTEDMYEKAMEWRQKNKSFEGFEVHLERKMPGQRQIEGDDACKK